MTPESEYRTFGIKIWDDGAGDLPRDSSGDEVIYDGQNVLDAAFWGDESDYMNPTTLLVLMPA